MQQTAHGWQHKLNGSEKTGVVLVPESTMKKIQFNHANSDDSFVPLMVLGIEKVALLLDALDTGTQEVIGGCAS